MSALRRAVRHGRRNAATGAETGPLLGLALLALALAILACRIHPLPAHLPAQASSEPSR